MVGVRRGLAVCLVGVVALLAVLDVGPTGWCVGLACAVVLAVAAGRRATVDGVAALGPADLVTLTRATLACGIAALVAEAFTGADVVGVLVPLTVVALVLDLVDGRVARRTGTASAYGARLDGEADAFLILVLSVLVARDHGAWVLGAGRDPLRVRRRGAPAALDAAAVAAALLAQGGGGLRRHRPDARRVRPRPGSATYAVLVVACPAARRVVRLGRGVAVAAPTGPVNRARADVLPDKGSYEPAKQVSGMRVSQRSRSSSRRRCTSTSGWTSPGTTTSSDPSFMLNAVGGARDRRAPRGVAALGAGVPGASASGSRTLLAFVLATTVGLFGVTANWTGWAVWVAAASEVVAVVAGARLLAADNPLALTRPVVGPPGRRASAPPRSRCRRGRRRWRPGPAWSCRSTDASSRPARSGRPASVTNSR